ncbi:hypothetical protein GCM10020220_093810 [Nonomuraea rubra]
MCMDPMSWPATDLLTFIGGGNNGTVSSVWVMREAGMARASRQGRLC